MKSSQKRYYSAVANQPMQNEFSEPLDVRSALILAGVFLAYLITARIGLSIDPVHTFATLIWPPSGIALAAYILYGYRVWPAIMSAAFLVNLSIGGPVLVSLCIAAGNTFGPALGAYLIDWYRSYRVYHPNTPPLRDNTGIVVIALVVPLITASVGAASLWWGDVLHGYALASTWRTWWIGDALGILIFTPLILKWINRPLLEGTRRQRIELGLVLAAVTLTTIFVFWSKEPEAAGFAYYLFLPLTWAALRTGPRGVTLSIFIASCIAVAGTYMGYGPFGGPGLLFLQMFLGSLAGVFLVFSTTVEERHNVLEALKQHTEELETALETISSEDEAKKEFLAVLAHELRNPLATILSSVELINLQGVAAANTSMLLESINERARAVVRLLDDLLDISRVSQKKLSLRKEIISVDRFIERLTPTVQQLIQKHGHDISVKKPAKELFVDADPVRLEQIFINLLTNAVKYTKPPGKIEIIVEYDPEEICVHVRDNGVGIPRNMLGRIFEPYFQINKNREGIGIGLPLTRQLVEMHGGTIEAKSRGLNRGSDFIVRLPLLADGHDMPLQHSFAGPLRPGRFPRHVKRTYKILLVDDNESATNALAQLLELRGHLTAAAYTGEAALKKALEFEPEIIVLDIGLPDIDGYEVAMELRKHNKNYFLIALTGYGQPEDKERAREAGFNRHLTKPAGFKEIEGILRRLPRSFRH